MLIAVSTLSGPCSKQKLADTKTVEEYLTGETWVVNELTFLQYNTLHTYKREGYSDAFLNDRISFRKGGIGVYTNTYNEEFNTTWQFTDEEKSKITLVIEDYSAGRPAKGKSQTVRLENVTVNNRSLRYAEIYTTNGSPTISSVYRIPLK